MDTQSKRPETAAVNAMAQPPCPNPGCSGTIGPDGSCSHCNKGVGPAPAGDETVIGEDWENRLLCSDPDCFGAIGPDGICRECGRAVGQGI